MSNIRLTSITHCYDHKIQNYKNRSHKKHNNYAVREITQTWEHGGAYALLGPSGCGKTTLLNIVSGSLTPSAGQVLFDGVALQRIPPQQRCVARVFQFPVVYDSMTVYDNLAFPLRNMKVPRIKIQTRIHEITEILGLEPLLGKKAKNLRTDEKQKISIARGLVRDDVSVILFDEPLLTIDPDLKWKLLRCFKQIHEKLKITMIYVTRNQMEACTFADNIAVMYKGKIVQCGTPRELFENPGHTFVGYFIGSPGMNLIPVHYWKNSVVFDDIKIPLNKKLAGLLADSSYSNLKIGIRPEFTHIGKQASDGAYLCNVVHWENLGNYKIVTLQWGKQIIKARLQEDDTPPDDKAYISLPAQWLKLYADDYLLEG